MTVNTPEDEPLIQVLLKQANDLTLLVSFSNTVPVMFIKNKPSLAWKFKATFR